MQKTFGKVIYDTELASVVYKHTVSYYGDPAGYEEILYRMPSGAHFVYSVGGATSLYPKETLVRLAKDKVSAWLDAHK